MSYEDKKDNVVGIGHNQNNYSKEQYAKLLNLLHRAHCFAQEEMNSLQHLFDEAFTKHPNSCPWEKKLKDFEVHERRARGNAKANKFHRHMSEDISAVEKKAKADGIELKLLKQNEESNDQ